MQTCWDVTLARREHPSRGRGDVNAAPAVPGGNGRRVFHQQFLHAALAGGSVALLDLLAGCASTPTAPVVVAPPAAPSAPPRVSAPPQANFAPLPSKLTPDAARQALVANALLLVGTPYRWGGAKPESGFDCSGLIRHVFAESLGWKLPLSARDQFKVGQEVERDDLLAADLLFFSTAGSRASHVALSIGGRRFVHAPNARGVVRIEELRGTYWLSQFDGGRRLISPA